MSRKVGGVLLWAFLIIPVSQGCTAEPEPLFVPGKWKDSLPDTTLFPLDGPWYARRQVENADAWNGGADGRQGFGAYLRGFSGYYSPHFDRKWTSKKGAPTTVIAQARGIFGNVEAALAAEALGQDSWRFKAAAQMGGEFLVNHFKDQEKGGYYWSVGPTGYVADDAKQGYGQMHAWLALCRLASLKTDPKWLEEAAAQYRVVTAHFLDPEYPGGVVYGKTRGFGVTTGNKNIDTFTHYFETLLAYWDVAREADKASAAQDILKAGKFLVETLAVPMEGQPHLRYVAYNYSPDWKPSAQPYTRERQWSGAEHASPGHAIELSFLLSRSVERGFPEEWLTAAKALLDYCLAYAVDPTTGGMRHDTLAYDGTPLKGNPDNAFYIYWAQGETLRALMHWSLVRDELYRTAFLKAQTFVFETLTDRQFGGWYPEITAATLEPARGDKGDNWKGNYHDAMMMAEAVRLWIDGSSVRENLPL